MITQTPQSCIQDLKHNFQNMKELIQLTDEIAIKNGFKLIKENGNKNHIYLYCHLAGKGREVVPDNLKKRNRKSKKQVNYFHLALSC